LSFHHFLLLFWDQIGGTVGFIASVTAIASVIYAVRNHIGTWPMNIVSVILFGVYFYEIKDPSNELLQILYYLPISIYGWYVWLRCGPTKNDDLPVTTLSNRDRLLWIAATTVVAIIVGAIEARFKKDAPLPYCDAATTVMSITAQYLQAKKKIENWVIWIVADLVYTFYMFPRQGYFVMAGVYGLFLIMAFEGARQWARFMKNGPVVSTIDAYEAEVGAYEPESAE
jgi:nicotinamide mononucleotide transporter